MRIANLNPDSKIGATSWFVDIEDNRILLDAGTHPKRDGKESLPLYDTIAREDIEAIAISHCHHDHVGSLPVALKYFPKANVLMTELSYFLVERVLHNSVNVMMRQKEELNIVEYPLFTHTEVDELAPVFQGFKYNREIEWSGFQKTQIGLPSATLEFYDAGHALGSSGIMLRGQKETMFFTGDVNFRDQTILKGARFEDVKADVLIMETTRGARATPEGFTREKEIERLAASIQRVLEARGSVLLPTFALGRTQEILALLALLMRQGKIPKQPVYIGGLGRVFTEIYDLEAHRVNRNHSNMKLTEAHNLIVLNPKQVLEMRLGGGRIFVITSGMMTEKTAAHELAARMVGDDKHAIYFVGYADPDSPGGKLRAAKHGETFILSASAGEVTKNCEVDSFDLTAHANREELLDFVDTVGPRTVILGHGDEDAKAWFAQQIRAKHPKINVLVPEPGQMMKV
jgi:Cft2 family RNA processing exonuclease